MNSNNPLGFFKEDNGSWSVMRLVFFLFSIHAIWSSTYVLIHDPKDHTGAISLFIAISGVAMGGKLFQKPMEKPAESTDAQNTKT
jgi:hypothetical protein